MEKIIFTDNWIDYFNAFGLNSVEDFFKFSSGQIVNQNSRRHVVAFSLGEGDERKDFFMKRFISPHLKDAIFAFRNYGRPLSQARLEWENANLLLQNGIETYHPVCCGEITCCGLEKKSFFITEKLTSQCMTDFVIEKWPSLADGEKIKIITSLGQMVRKLHDAHISMRDLYMWHVFITPMNDGNYDFAIIDLHRLEKNVTNRRKLVKNLGTLLFTMLPIYFNDELKQKFFDAYTRSDAADLDSRMIKSINHRIKILSRRRRGDPTGAWGVGRTTNDKRQGTGNRQQATGTTNDERQATGNRQQERQTANDRQQERQTTNDND